MCQAYMWGNMKLYSKNINELWRDNTDILLIRRVHILKV